MKQRLSAIDIRALVAALKRKGLIGMKINNIYDISGKQYLIKVQRGSKKQMLLIQSGVRFHTTSFQRDKNQIPSAYSMKLRKYIRSKYITDIKQLGTDRVVLIQISQGEEFYNLILQFYAQGNIILADRQFVILALLRSHRFDDQIKIAVKEKYPFGLAANQDISSVICSDQAIVNTWMEAKHQAQMKEKEETGSKKKKSGNTFNLKALLMKIVPFINTQYAEHALRAVGVTQINKKIEDSDIDVLGKSARLLVRLVLDIDEFAKGQFQQEMRRKQMESQAEEIKSNDNDIEIEQEEIQNKEDDKQKKQFSANGYILASRFKPKTQKSEEEGNNDNQFQGLKFQDFSPVMLEQYNSAVQKDKQLLEFQSFDQCIDIFFSQMDIQKFEAKSQQKENQIWKKVERMKKDQQSRIVGLKQEQSLSIYKAKLLQSKLYELQGIITILNLMIHSGLDWKEIWRMIKQEQRNQNQFALTIHHLVLQKNIVELLLYSQNDQYFDDFSDIAEQHRDLTNQVFKVDIDLTLSAQMNINRYFQIKKKAVNKEIKTKSAAQSALKQAQKHANKEMKVHQQAVKMEQLRKIYWFQKFDWFITSQNYLVIAGKNAQQNEILVKRYMNKCDIYVHADINGAATTIVKNHNQQEPVPPVTLNEAAVYAVCHSSSWNAKVPVGAYWVFPSQVSKTPPSGEYLPTGSFMIRGKKNFLLPPKLEMGVTVLFKFDEENLQNHLNERGVKVQGDGESMMDMEDIANEDDFLEEEELVEDEQGEQNEEDENKEEEQVIGQNEAEDQASEPQIQNTQTQDQTKTQQIKQKEKQQVYIQQLQYQQLQQQQNQQQQKAREAQTQVKDTKKKQPHQNNKKDKKGKVINQSEDQQLVTKPKQQQKQQQLPRGKKFKLKKMKQKYADQDEEQKQLKMELLGIKNIQTKKKKPQKPQQKKWQNEKKEYKGPRKLKEISPQQEEMAKQAAMKEMTGSLNEINLLTGLPRENDTILYALTMCAPYSSITNYKYRVKLLPGTLRRGKAQKTIKQLFVNQSKTEKNEVHSTLMRSINDQQMTMNMIGSIRVFAPGLNKMKQKKK